MAQRGELALNDEEIVLRLQRGDVSGLDALLREHGPFVKAALRQSFQFVNDEHDLESALLDGALIMWKRDVSNRLDPSKGIRAYFYVTCRRELMRAWKNKPAEQLLDPTVVDATFASQGAMERAGGGPSLEDIMAGLSSLERGILMADMAANFTASSAELAALLETTSASVDSLKYRIRKKLRRWLGGSQ